MSMHVYLVYKIPWVVHVYKLQIRKIFQIQVQEDSTTATLWSDTSAGRLERGIMLGLFIPARDSKQGRCQIFGSGGQIVWE